jgi:hypothetical protein
MRISISVHCNDSSILEMNIILSHLKLFAHHLAMCLYIVGHPCEYNAKQNFLVCRRLLYLNLLTAYQL